VQEAIKLFANGSYYWLTTMPYVEATDAAGEVDIAVSIYIFKPSVFGLGHIHWGSVREPSRHGGVAALCQRFGFWSGDRGS